MSTENLENHPPQDVDHEITTQSGGSEMAKTAAALEAVGEVPTRDEDDVSTIRTLDISEAPSKTEIQFEIAEGDGGEGETGSGEAEVETVGGETETVAAEVDAKEDEAEAAAASTSGGEETETRAEAETVKTEEDEVAVEAEAPSVEAESVTEDVAEGEAKLEEEEEGAAIPADEVVEKPPPEKPSKKPRQSFQFERAAPTGRFKSIDMSSTVTGDFQSVSINLDIGSFSLGTFADPEKVLVKGEEEAKSESSTSEEEPQVDRAMYYELYKVYENRYTEAYLKNNFLQRKLADFFRRRRMHHVLQESELQSDTQRKYELKLDALEALYEVNTNERAIIEIELKEIQIARNKKREEVNLLFENMQKRESEIGKDLMTTKTGQENLEKVVERLIKRQKLHMDNIIKMRLKFVKLKNQVAEKQATLKALDNLGPNLHLIDYEQLKVDNRNFQEKLEERENELIRLRQKCQNNMQRLAHMREKFAAIEVEIEKLKAMHEAVNIEFEQSREQLICYKQERDYYRDQINKLKEESGLLFRPKLLDDMQETIEKIDQLSIKLEEAITQHDLVENQLQAIRKNLEIKKKELMDNNQLFDNQQNIKKTSILFKGRPSLLNRTNDKDPDDNVDNIIIN